jgi:hypothetical protein
MKHLGLNIQGAFFNADKAFDTLPARKTCFNYGVIPIQMKTSVIVMAVNEVANAYSTRMLINIASRVRGLLFGWINLELC